MSDKDEKAETYTNDTEHNDPQWQRMPDIAERKTGIDIGFASEHKEKKNKVKNGQKKNTGKDTAGWKGVLFAWYMCEEQSEYKVKYTKQYYGQGVCEKIDITVGTDPRIQCRKFETGCTKSQREHQRKDKTVDFI